MITLNFAPGCHFIDVYILSGLIIKFLITVSEDTGETIVFLSPLPRPTEYVELFHGIVCYLFTEKRYVNM